MGQAIIGKMEEEDACILAFRGSDNIQNWLKDLQAWSVTPADFKGCKGCKVEAGWHKIWEDVRHSSLNALRDVGCEPGSHKIHVTGHSLGGAIAHLAMFALEGSGYEVASSYTFEAPRVGNRAFSEEFSKHF